MTTLPDQNSQNTDQNPPQNKWRSLLEFGPLILFFGVNFFFGIYAGTAALVGATLISLILSWRLERRLPKMAAFGCLLVVFFGGLTIVMADEFYIKIKPTVASLAIAGVILIGYLIGRNPVRAMMGHLPLPAESKVWRDLTFSFIIMMVTMAAANEVAWRHLTTQQWATFKVFGLTGISLMFGVVVMMILHRYQHEMPADDRSENEGK